MRRRNLRRHLLQSRHLAELALAGRGDGGGHDIRAGASGRA